MSNTISTPVTSRVTVKALDARMARLEQAIADLTASLQAPAKTTPVRKATTARKAPAKKASPKVTPKATVEARVTKGSQARVTGGLTRKAWNETLCTKARLAGSADGVSVYSRLMAAWADVQVLRAEGFTPDEVLGDFVATK